MALTLFNTLTHRAEVFTPLNAAEVRMYVCGPTVYDRPHLGNARSIVVYDLLYRLLCQLYPRVTYVRNITDVDDKINAAARDNNEPIQALTDRITAAFHHDIAALNALPPTHEPCATTHIPQMIAMIEKLIAGGHAYVAHSHVYFAVASDPNYGLLSRRTRDEMIAGSRVEVSEFKQDPADFVLWKPSEAGDPGWESPWGRGRPGWHIECSVMSTEYLTPNFDLHGGGADLQFPHHENEIAQSTCAYPGSQFARYWVHNGFLTVNGEKMSKSLGNFITVHDLLSRGVPGETIRYAFLSTHYRKPLDWSDKALHDAQMAMTKFYQLLATAPTSGEPDRHYAEQGLAALCDDLNTAKYLALLHELAKEIHKAEGERRAQLGFTLRVLGQQIGLFYQEEQAWNPVAEEAFSAEEIVEIEALVAARNQARANKQWQEADRLRDVLKAKGIVLEDTPQGTGWKRG